MNSEIRYKQARKKNNIQRLEEFITVHAVIIEKKLKKGITRINAFKWFTLMIHRYSGGYCRRRIRGMEFLSMDFLFYITYCLIYEKYNKKLL